MSLTISLQIYFCLLSQQPFLFSVQILTTSILISIRYIKDSFLHTFELCKPFRSRRKKAVFECFPRKKCFDSHEIFNIFTGQNIKNFGFVYRRIPTCYPYPFCQILCNFVSTSLNRVHKVSLEGRGAHDQISLQRRWR